MRSGSCKSCREILIPIVEDFPVNWLRYESGREQVDGVVLHLGGRISLCGRRKEKSGDHGFDMSPSFAPTRDVKGQEQPE
jgi:hypothetical protein